jgi:hypothetical protein
MKVTMKSMASGKVNTLDIDCTPEQIERFNQGALVQEAFPNLSPDHREFLLTGITADEWNEMFKEEE